MSDWQVGDLALCLEIEMNTGTVPSGLRVGGVYTVAGVVCHRDQTGLVLEDYPSWHPSEAWCASSFRKILPDEQEACEPEFVTLLKRSKRKVFASVDTRRMVETRSGSMRSTSGAVPNEDSADAHNGAHPLSRSS